MSTKVDETEFSEELFEHTRMSFWDHIEELRSHLWRAIIGFFLALIVSLYFGDDAVKFIAKPVEEQLVKFYDRRVKKTIEDVHAGTDKHIQELNQPTSFERLTFYRPQVNALLQGEPTKIINDGKRPFNSEKEWEVEKKANEAAGKDPPEKVIVTDADLLKLYVRIERPVEWTATQAKAQREIIKPPTLATMSPIEAFMVWLKVSMYLGVIIGSPWIFYQLWSFVAAGLYPSEKHYVHRYLPLSVTLFVGGAAFCQFAVIPVALGYLLSWNESLGLEPDLRLNEWLTFAILFPLLFGVSFQTPVLMLVLYKVGIVEVETYIKHWRVALFGMAIAAMFLAASPDPISMMLMMIPLWMLYLLGILLCKLLPRPKIEEDETDAGELVGV